MSASDKKLPANRPEAQFEDLKPPYDAARAQVEANRCLYCYDPPCVKACPTSIDIPQFIRRIADDNTRGAAKSIFESNILGMSCARVCPVEVLCVGDCVLNEAGIPPIQIGRLQRFATDQAFVEGWEYFEAGAPTGKKVAVVGGGPASLAAAHQLRRFGHAVDIVEKSTWLGGLNTTGIAPYKMKADRSLEEVQWILSIGEIGLRTGLSVPDQLGWEELERDYDAVFLGLGLGSDTILDIEGTELNGVHGAVDLIANLKLGRATMDDIRCAVILGGGNTAIDAARQLRGLGVDEVILAYRGQELTMSGYRHEWEQAAKEGIIGCWGAQPTAILGGAREKVKAVRFRPVGLDKGPTGEEDFEIECDLVAFAVGQQKLGSLVDGLDGLQVERGRIVVDEKGATGRPGFYAGGDCANGGMEVVNAAAEGKAAAQAIHEYLAS